MIEPSKTHQGTPQRNRCQKGHLIQRGYKTYCRICQNQKLYYKKRIKLGMSALEARPRNMQNHRQGVAKAMRRYRAKWSNPDSNPTDRFLRSLGRHLGLANREEVKEYIAKNGVPKEGWL